MKMVCIRCGAEIQNANSRTRFCQACRPEHDLEMQRICVDRRREREKQPKINRCVRCGRPRGDQRTYCVTCAVLHEQEEQRMKTRAMPERDKQLYEMVHPEPKPREVHFSAQFTGNEIDKLAKKYHTSYGKMRAWMDCHNRLPKEGEQMF